MYVILLLCEFVGLFLITTNCESMTNLQSNSVCNIRVMTKSDNRAAEVRFVYHEHDNKLSDKKKVRGNRLKMHRKFFPMNFRIASTRVPQRYK